MPKLREKAPEKVSFTIRYEAATLARIDAYAERGGITRAEATRAVLAAGIEALDAVGGPTLADVLTRWPEVRINIDIKSSGAIRPLWDCIVEYEAFDRVCVGSFSDRRLGAFRRLTRGQVATAAGPRETASIRFLSDRLARPATARAQVLQIPETIRLRGKVIRLVTPELLARAHNAGMQVHVWTINDADDMRRLFDLGVDGIVSDRIDLLADVLAERGAWPPAR